MKKKKKMKRSRKKEMNEMRIRKKQGPYNKPC